MKSDDFIDESFCELEQVLYSLNDSKEKMDFSKLENIFLKVLKRSVLDKNYMLYVANYEINILPESLAIIYDDGNTYLEVSSMDYYEEASRKGENKFFVIDNDIATNVYGSLTPYLLVREDVVSINGECMDVFCLELVNTEDKIENYIVDKDMEIRDNKAIKSVVISKDCDRFEIEQCLDLKKIKRAQYVLATNKFIVKNSDDSKLSYKDLLPDISWRKRVMEKMYKCILLFYKDWLSKNIVEE